MAIKRFLLACVMGCVAVLPTPVHAEERPQYSFGRVTEIFSETPFHDHGMDEVTQRVHVRISTGPDAGTDTIIEYTVAASGFEQQRLSVGDTLIVAPDTVIGEGYVVLDTFRLPGVFVVFCGFLLLAIYFAGFRGLSSVAGLATSLAILTFGVVPGIMSGMNPLLVCLIGAGGIAIVSLLLTHGFNRRSYVALAATLLTLVGGVIFSLIAVALANLSGSGTEEAVYLQLGSLTPIDLRGLLLGGMIIGVLGVLDDVTTAQVAAVEEISIADRTLSAKELYTRGLRIGREHIAALVNTLALAYAGASFPLFLLFAIEGGPPLWVVLNTEYVMEEVIRALVGGASLIIAVPISTSLAAYYVVKYPGERSVDRAGHHH